jgi:hypothetical protein
VARDDVVLVLHILAFLAGALIVARALLSAVRTFALPRANSDSIVRAAMHALRIVFNGAMRLAPDYRRRDAIMALYGPVGLILLVPLLLSLLEIGFAMMFWGIGAGDVYRAFTLSGSSLLTLGFVTADNAAEYVLAFLEAISGTFMLALLISYLPTIYSMFSKREILVTGLEVSAGSPPWAVTFVDRSFLIRRFDENDLDRTWREWNSWFTELEESHTSLPMLPFFRSQQPNRSWIVAAGTVLDAAAIVRSSVDIPMNPRADLMIRSGYLALKAIAASYGFVYDPQPAFPRTPIHVSRAEFEDAYARLAAAGVPMKPDVERCWINFAGWRVNYDAQLLDLCAVVMAPEAPWSSDRCHGRWTLTPRFRDRNVDPTSISSAEANSEDAVPDAVAGH